MLDIFYKNLQNISKKFRVCYWNSFLDAWNFTCFNPTATLHHLRWITIVSDNVHQICVYQIIIKVIFFISAEKSIVSFKISLRVIEQQRGESSMRLVNLLCSTVSVSFFSLFATSQTDGTPLDRLLPLLLYCHSLLTVEFTWFNSFHS